MPGDGEEKGPEGPGSLLDGTFPHLRGSLQLTTGLGHLGIETWHRSGGDGQGLGLLDDLLGVDVDAIDAELKMQMGPCGPPCGAYGTDGLAFLHGLTLAHVDLAQVGVQGGMAIAVTHFDDIAITALDAGKCHHAITHGLGRCAGGGGVVQSPVRLLGLEDGVQTHGETTGLA